MCHENLIVHVLRIYIYICFINAFSKLSLILVYKENMHWFRNSFELVQLRQILEANCGYAMNLGLVRQERDWKKINNHDMFYEHIKRFSVWGPCDSRKVSRGFIPCRPATSKATRGCIPCKLVAVRLRGVIIPCRLTSRKATRGFIPCRLVSRKATRG